MPTSSPQPFRLRSPALARCCCATSKRRRMATRLPSVGSPSSPMSGLLPPSTPACGLPRRAFSTASLLVSLYVDESAQRAVHVAHIRATAATFHQEPMEAQRVRHTVVDEVDVL